MEWITVGKVVKRIGLKGQVKIYPYGDGQSLAVGTTLRTGKHTYQIQHLHYVRNMPVVQLEGIESVERADALVQQEVEIDRQAICLAEDEYLVVDLLGLEAFSEDGERLGVLRDVLSPSQQDVYVIEDEQGHEILIPAVEAFVRQVDLEARRLVVRLLEGMR